MDEPNAFETGLRVSVQARGALDRVAGHLGAGLLVDADTVIVPDPLDAVLAADADLEVLIFSVPVGRDPDAEVMRPTQCRILCLEEGAACVLALRLPTRSRFEAQVSEMAADVFQEAFRVSGGNLWQTLHELKAVPARAGDVPEPDLVELTRAERTRSRPQRRVEPQGSLDELGFGICKLVRGCRGE